MHYAPAPCTVPPHALQIIDLTGESNCIELFAPPKIKQEPPCDTTLPNPKSPTPKVLLRWTYTGEEVEKRGREYVLTDDVFGGLVARSDSIAKMGAWGQCRVEGVNDKGFLHVLNMDPMHLHYEQCATLPPEDVYLCGNGRQELTMSEDFDSR